ncbi:exonuclease III [Paenibacillus jamilae]|jgi:exonuclease III|uniref:hypothetical protein n=1 Tax=Paenibacillus polymyxa TaxID=1406 RepID=UPI001580316C|nr:hypothetical protein [Paenibacillus polymyxa]MDP9676243.1 exonuclease III [Paenibacillus jamilae]MBY0024525.1 hypothetical protein [Paenibacillus polymyxa]MBY0058653.1 hypothetical protein [Paenibacillus polymyxa]MBY0071239.1 hypothetical protein [Paenibacillus polymyxa]MBY0078605.1 hypothetical protein [Paenibacillus polymyxa]
MNEQYFKAEKGNKVVAVFKHHDPDVLAVQKLYFTREGCAIKQSERPEYDSIASQGGGKGE